MWKSPESQHKIMRPIIKMMMMMMMMITYLHIKSSTSTKQWIVLVIPLSLPRNILNSLSSWVLLVHKLPGKTENSQLEIKILPLIQQKPLEISFFAKLLYCWWLTKWQTINKFKIHYYPTLLGRVQIKRKMSKHHGIFVLVSFPDCKKKI